MRYFAPILLMATGVFILWYNGTHAHSVVMLPFVDSVLPATEGDLVAQGRISAVAFFALGGLLLFWNVFQNARARRERAALEGEEHGEG